MSEQVPGRRVLYWVMCAAPPVLDWKHAADQLMGRGWAVYAVPTPTAASWLDLDRLAAVTGHLVRVHARLPHEPDPLPPANVVLLAPTTFNTINKWAAGINDTVALGLLNECLAARVPIVAAVYCKPALAAHPVFQSNVALLRHAGANILQGEGSVVTSDGGFSWAAVLDALDIPRP